MWGSGPTLPKFNVTREILKTPLKALLPPGHPARLRQLFLPIKSRLNQTPLNPHIGSEKYHYTNTQVSRPNSYHEKSTERTADITIVRPKRQHRHNAWLRSSDGASCLEDAAGTS